jgi:hypothetical protein
MTSLSDLSAQWIEAKAREAKATKERRDIEDKMRSLIGVPDNLDGTTTAKPDGFVVKVTGRINRKVNGDLLQELAAENGLIDHLTSLFRWKPEINMAAWKATDAAITTPLLKAITSEAGRPSFAITIQE